MDLSKNHGTFIHAEQYEKDLTEQNNTNKQLLSKITDISNKLQPNVVYDSLDLKSYFSKGIIHFINAKIISPNPIEGIDETKSYNGFLINIPLYDDSTDHDSFMWVSNLDGTGLKIYCRTVLSYDATEKWEMITTK